MNPGKGLARGIPLERAGGLTRGASLDRSCPLPARRATPRRTDREHVCCGAAVGKRITRERSAGLCEIAVVCGGTARATNASHRKAKGRGGCYCPFNLVDACGMGNASGCHGWVHADPGGEATAAGLVVPTGLDPERVPVRLARWGLVLLDAAGGLTLVR